MEPDEFDISVRCARSAAADSLAAVDAVSAVGVDAVASGAAGHGVARCVVDLDEVAAGAGVDAVAARTARDVVCAPTAEDAVMSGVAAQVVVGGRARDDVVSGAAVEDGVDVAGRCGQNIVAGAAFGEHVAGARNSVSADCVVACATVGDQKRAEFAAEEGDVDVPIAGGVEVQSGSGSCGAPAKLIVAPCADDAEKAVGAADLDLDFRRADSLGRRARRQRAACKQNVGGRFVAREPTSSGLLF